MKQIKIPTIKEQISDIKTLISANENLIKMDVPEDYKIILISNNKILKEKIAALGGWLFLNK